MLFKLISFSLFLFVPFALLLVNFMVNHKGKMHRNLMSAFECGFDSFSNARISFSLHFFLITIIFLVFDLEIIFLLPIPFLSKFSSTITFLMMVIIPIILFLGTVHEWNEGSLNWF